VSSPSRWSLGCYGEPGYRSRWLTSVSEKERLCRSIASGSSRPYVYMVYLDESVKPPAYRVIVEKLGCS